MLTFATGQGADEQEGFSDYYFLAIFLDCPFASFVRLHQSRLECSQVERTDTFSVRNRRSRRRSRIENNKLVRESRIQNRTPEDEGLRFTSSTAANEPAAGSSTAANEPAADDFVCIIGQGEKYHRPNCGMVCAPVNRHRVINLLRGAAINAGYTACKQCRPR